VFRTAAIGGGAAAKRAPTIAASRRERGVVFVHPDEDVEGFYILGGEQILFYDKRLARVDGRLVPAEVITDVWTDIGWTGIANEGGVAFKNGKKPEALVRRVLEMATQPGDLVLDSFAGSGTTLAVAHKLRRRWIGVECGEHALTHCIPRLRRVVDGTDATGISGEVGWRGGGGFRFCHVAPAAP
jgi:adenine-specific DNA-methyltransferase